MSEPDSHDALNINIHGVLKPPPLLWVIMLFETRHWWLSVFIAFSGQTWLFAENYTTLIMVAEIPALLVLLALSRRHPGSHNIFKWLWHHGRELLSLTAFISAGIILWEWIQLDYWSAENEFRSIITLGLHFWVLIRLWSTDLMKMLFTEFPE